MSNIRTQLPASIYMSWIRLGEPGDVLVQEMEELRRHMLPILHQLETLQEASFGADRDLSSLQLLVRRTKEQLAD